MGPIFLRALALLVAGSVLGLVLGAVRPGGLVVTRPAPPPTCQAPVTEPADACSSMPREDASGPAPVSR